MAQCNRCGNRLTFAQQKVQYGRALQRQALEVWRAKGPLCQKCMTVLLDAGNYPPDPRPRRTKTPQGKRRSLP